LTQCLLHNLYKKTMRKYSILFLSLALLLSSCSYQQFGAVATGSSLGGMFGSSIGGLMGGPRGSDKGTLAGMVIGGVVGAAATASHNNNAKNSDNESYYDDVDVYNRHSNGDVQYGTYNSPTYQSPAAATSDLEYIEVTNLHFLDSNNNQRLDRDEEAFIVMDIYNRGDRTLYNLTPRISCDSKRVLISPAASIGNLSPGQGVRYKAAVKSTRRTNEGYLLFSVGFGTGKQAVTAKQFKILTGSN